MGKTIRLLFCTAFLISSASGMERFARLLSGAGQESKSLYDIFTAENPSGKRIFTEPACGGIVHKVSDTDVVSFTYSIEFSEKSMSFQSPKSSKRSSNGLASMISGPSLMIDTTVDSVLLRFFHGFGMQFEIPVILGVRKETFCANEMATMLESCPKLLEYLSKEDIEEYMNTKKRDAADKFQRHDGLNKALRNIAEPYSMVFTLPQGDGLLRLSLKKESLTDTSACLQPFPPAFVQYQKELSSLMTNSLSQEFLRQFKILDSASASFGRV